MKHLSLFCSVLSSGAISTVQGGTLEPPWDFDIIIC